ncbi:hypothetical protein [Kineosporia sp. NBRC 101731]|uniref:hypothetical protein n=1 Tax=Kineosporia sp. NBRC 101731 TaxID=3032199 RepID=UPI0024A2A2BB|nr:hypothetical protein [Kineosporia sp. NBRC 101731]GLY32088.1 hypothetical protein Kisp02_54530 [Kineosporia sp. NBRC 101731]
MTDETRIGDLTATPGPDGWTATRAGRDLPGVYDSVETAIAATHLTPQALLQAAVEATDEGRPIAIEDIEVARMVDQAPPLNLDDATE